MVMPASGPISFAAIQGEFGGTNPISMPEYYGSDDYYLPQSGTIRASDFHNSTPETVVWTTAAFSTSEAADPRPLAGIYLHSDGGLYEYISGTGVYTGQNAVSTYSSARTTLYECKWVKVSGSNTNWSAPTENVWVLLSTIPIFKYIPSPIVNSTMTFDLYVRALGKSATQVIKRVDVSTLLSGGA